ncbi:MAG: FecR domain-containing protein, partial [Blastocatellia bacterium]|nr:FecR domain-containing protein [Blastocatellia bacterium]
MKFTNRELNVMIDDLTAEIREEKVDAATVAGAAERVWTRLAGGEAAAEIGATPVEHIRGCADFQALIPPYLHGVLSSARTMLLEDHVRDCVPCRKALKEARSGNQNALRLEAQKARVAADKRLTPALRWAAAAVLVAGLGILAWPWAQRLFNFAGTLQAVVEASSGNVYRVTDEETRTVKVGEKLQRGERIRTARGATALVRLSDGSSIEMRERTELSINDKAAQETINLERGNIIVDKAKRPE